MVISKINKSNKPYVNPWRNIEVYALKIRNGIIEDNWLYFLYFKIIDYLTED